MKKNMLFPIMSILAFTWSGLMPAYVQADETIETKVKNAAEDVKTDAKKNTRKAKRKARKARGEDNVIKDAGDKVQDAGDDVNKETKKAKNKLEE
jgi:hypothetical protein